jgi:uncharacterized protein YqjF (DUF2071 family)
VSNAVANESVARLLQARKNPARTPVMYQRWDDLLFLHWRCETEHVAALLPLELTADLYEGESYISIVAFRMNTVRPAYLPALPWLSSFCELNVRVYVRDQHGEPGVYFLSLDCNRAPAVWLARAAFSLPYQHAIMSFSQSFDRSGQNNIIKQISCRRVGCAESAQYHWSAPLETRVLHPETLEFFLTERYNFFTLRRGVLMRGQVHHKPYEVSTPTLHRWSALPIAWDSFPLVSREPDLISYSPGVAISAFGLQPT